MSDFINYEDIEELADKIKEIFYKLGETLCEVVEKIREILDDLKVETNKPKYKLVKSLVKPYKPPFIKVRYRARANLKKGGE